MKSKESECFPRIQRYAVFGANGYIGSQLAYLLQRGAVDVTLFAVQEHHLSKNNMAYKQFDVRDPANWNDFDPNMYDVIFYFAGLTGTEGSFSNAIQFLSVNEGGLLCLCQRLAMLGSNAPKVIFPSTRLVYKGAVGGLCEEAEKQTKTLYAVNKLACENILYAYNNLYNIPYVIMRICVPYGTVCPTSYAYGTIGYFLNRAREGLPIPLFGGGVQRRSFTHVADICSACMQIAERKDINAGVFNIGGENFSLFEVASLIANKFSIAVEPIDWPVNDLKLESGDTVFDDAKLIKEIGDYRSHVFNDWLHSN